MSERVCIIGPGRLGLALGAALRRTRSAERLVYIGRALDPPPHPLFEPHPDGFAAEYRLGPVPIPAGTTVLILSVPERAVAEVAYDVAALGPAPTGCVALHTAGALTSDVLGPLHSAGYAIGSLFPMVTVADAWQPPDRLIGATYAIAGEPAAVGAARRVVDALEGRALLVPATLRPLFHAATTLASGHVMALLLHAADILERAGVPPGDALAALVPLARGRMEDLEKLGLRAALTGPIATGDADAVRMHLSRLSGEERALYCALGRELLQHARAAGLDPRRADQVDAALSRD